MTLDRLQKWRTLSAALIQPSPYFALESKHGASSDTHESSYRIIYPVGEAMRNSPLDLLTNKNQPRLFVIYEVVTRGHSARPNISPFSWRNSMLAVADEVIDHLPSCLAISVVGCVLAYPNDILHRLPPVRAEGVLQLDHFTDRRDVRQREITHGVRRLRVAGNVGC